MVKDLVRPTVKICQQRTYLTTSKLIFSLMFSSRKAGRGYALVVYQYAIEEATKNRTNAMAHFFFS